MKTISISDKTHAQTARLAEVFGLSVDECVERLLERFAFESMQGEINVVVAEAAEQIICRTQAEAGALASRLEAFGGENRKNDPDECLVRAAPVKYDDGWVVKTVRTHGTV